MAKSCSQFQFSLSFCFHSQRKLSIDDTAHGCSCAKISHCTLLCFTIISFFASQQFYIPILEYPLFYFPLSLSYSTHKENYLLEKSALCTQGSCDMFYHYYILCFPFYFPFHFFPHSHCTQCKLAPSAAVLRFNSFPPLHHKLQPMDFFARKADDRYHSLSHFIKTDKNRFLQTDDIHDVLPVLQILKMKRVRPYIIFIV